MEEKTLFKEYEQWCVENKKDPLKEENIKEFKLYKEKEKEEPDKELVQKQKEIFAMMCNYCGIKAKYNEKAMFEDYDSIIRSVVMDALLLGHEEEINGAFSKVLERK